MMNKQGIWYMYYWYIIQYKDEQTGVYWLANQTGLTTGAPGIGVGSGPESEVNYIFNNMY